MVHPVHPVHDFRAVMRLRQVYRALEPDVIHTHQNKAGILGRMAAQAVPDAVVAHGIHIAPFEGGSPAKRAFYIAAERLVARRTDVFIGVSEAVGQSYGWDHAQAMCKGQRNRADLRPPRTPRRHP